LNVAGRFGLNSVAAATPSIGFAVAGFCFFDKLLLTAESFGSGLMRVRPGGRFGPIPWPHCANCRVTTDGTIWITP
jgi:hypothetical protein